MASFNASGTGWVSPAADRARQASIAARERARLAALPDGDKVKLLARAFRDAAARRGAITALDGVQMGFSEADVQRLYQPALARARRNDPAVFEPGGGA